MTTSAAPDRVQLARRIRRTLMTLLLLLIFWTIGAAIVGAFGDLFNQSWPGATPAATATDVPRTP